MESKDASQQARATLTEEVRHTLIDRIRRGHYRYGQKLPGEVELKVGAVEGVQGCEVKIVWDPPWNPSMMTEEAQLELGMIY